LPTAHDEDRLVDLKAKRFREFRFLRSDDAHPQAIFGEHLSVFVVRSVAPNDQLSEVDPLGQASIERESIHVESRRTCGNDQSVCPALDLPPDQVDSFIATQRGMALALLYAALVNDNVLQSLDIKRFVDITTLANPDSYLLVFIRDFALRLHNVTCVSRMENG